MKIVTAKEFLEIKKPVIYQEYFDIFQWGDLSLKYDNCGNNDFFKICLMGQDIFTKEIEPQDSGELYYLIEQVEKTGECFERDYEMTAREGGIDTKQRYIVYDDNDIARLIKVLQKILQHK